MGTAKRMTRALPIAAMGLAAVLLMASPASAAAPINWGIQTSAAGTDLSYGVATDAAGNVYVIGSTSGSLFAANAGSTDGFAFKLNQGGTFQWGVQWGTPGIDEGSAIAVSAGGVYAAGSTTGNLGGANAGANDAYVRKLDLATGAPLWTRQFGTAAADLGSSVATDPSGNIFVSGSTGGSIEGVNVGGDDAYVRKYDSAGTASWTDQFGTSGADRSFGVDTDPSGNAFVVGDTTGVLEGANAGATDAFIQKHDALGPVLWTDQFGTSGSDTAWGVSGDFSGNAFVAGDTSGNLEGVNVGGVDAFAVEYHATGSQIWTDQFGTASTDSARAASNDNLGNSFFAGFTGGSLSGPSAGGIDVFMQFYDPLAGTRRTDQFGSAGTEEARGVAADSLGQVSVSGGTSGALFGPVVGSQDTFVAGIDAQPPACTITGTPGDDVLPGTNGNDVICGLGGNDKINAMEGNDYVFGGPGNDQIFGGGGRDILYGEAGQDELLGKDGGDYLDGGADDDPLWGGAGGDEIHGGPGNDAANAFTGNDALYGEAGADQLQGGGGNDLFSGGLDDDLLMGQPGGDRFDGADGNDAIQAGGGNDFFDAGPGADQVVTGEGFDVGFTRDGDDKVIETTGGVDVRSGNGNDVLIGGTASDALRAGPGDDKAYGGEDSDHIHGDAGHDVIDGGLGDDRPTAMCPGCGLWGDQHGTLPGHTVGDDYKVTDGNDSILGGAGNDAIYGGGGNDTMFGTDGDDYFEDAEGDNVVQSGTGSDYVLLGFYTSTSGLGNVPGTVSGLGSGNNAAQTGEQIDTIITGSGNDSIMSGADDDTINAGDGNNVINSMGGFDNVTTGAGNDEIATHEGIDTIHAGAGDDKVFAGADDDKVVAGAGNDTVNGEGGFDEIWLGADNDKGYGELGVDKIYGGNGDDELVGGADDDTLIGEGGIDVAYGGPGASDTCDAETEFDCEIDPIAFVVPPEP